MNDPLKRYRKSYRERRNRRRLDREAAHYKALFLERGLAVPDDNDISETIRSRFPQTLGIGKGNLDIIAVYPNYNWENESLIPALEKFGRVRHYDWSGVFDHGARTWDASQKKEMNRDLVEFVSGLAHAGRAHFIFTYLSGALVYPSTVLELSKLGIPSVNLALNDKEAFVGKIRRGIATGSRDICRHFSLCWTSTRDALEKYCVEGALPVYLPEGANPDVHRPHDLEKTFDVTFVGQRYGNRPEIVEGLSDAGIRVEAFGSGWPNGPLSTEEMVKMYSRSRINLGFGGIAGHRDAFCLKGRDFEVPMSGGLYMTEHHEELERFYDVGREILTYTGIDDLVEKVRWVLSHPGEAESIRITGRKRALREHTWEMRFEKVLRLTGILD